MPEAKSIITFENLSFNVCNKKETKSILNKISGTFPSGKLIAMLGPSGAGKTTLLNTLSGWEHKSHITGNIKVNNENRNKRDFKNMSCYITQDSYLINDLTVEENLRFAADLKLGRNISKNDKEAIISDVTNTFGLTPHMQTLTGKLSGGQMKRLAICLELLNSPDIVFLDEPTTGLDIVSVSKCMRYLKHLSKKGITIICTMHQPPGNVVKMFDIVYIVAKGQCVYQGGPDQLVTFLTDNDVPCNIFHSPIDYIIDLANGDFGTNVLHKMVAASQNGKNLQYMAPLKAQDMQLAKAGPGPSKAFSIQANCWNYSLANDWYEIRTLFKREIILATRDWYMTYLRFFGVFANSLMIGLVCYNLGSDKSLIYFNYNMILLHISMLTLAFATTAAATFLQTQNVLRNEYENGYYSLRNYYITTTIRNWPVTFLSVLVGGTVLYYLSGQYLTLMRVYMFVIVSIEITLVADGIGSIAGAIFDTAPALFVATAIHIPIYVVSGYGLTILDMPPLFYYLSYLAYTRYAVRALMNTTMGFDRPAIECPENVVYCHYRNSIDYLNHVGIENSSIFYDIIALAILYLIYKLIAYLIIRFRLRNSVHKPLFSMQ